MSTPDRVVRTTRRPLVDVESTRARSAAPAGYADGDRDSSVLVSRRAGLSFGFSIQLIDKPKHSNQVMIDGEARRRGA